MWVLMHAYRHKCTLSQEAPTHTNKIRPYISVCTQVGKQKMGEEFLFPALKFDSTHWSNLVQEARGVLWVCWVAKCNSEGENSKTKSATLWTCDLYTGTGVAQSLSFLVGNSSDTCRNQIPARDGVVCWSDYTLCGQIEQTYKMHQHFTVGGNTHREKAVPY